MSDVLAFDLRKRHNAVSDNPYHQSPAVYRPKTSGASPLSRSATTHPSRTVTRAQSLMVTSHRVGGAPLAPSDKTDGQTPALYVSPPPDLFRAVVTLGDIRPVTRRYMRRDEGGDGG
jgi:hypothetical protein